MQSEIVVIAKCISCGHKREIRAGEVAKDDMPMCERCYGVMVAERSAVRAIRREQKKP